MSQLPRPLLILIACLLAVWPGRVEAAALEQVLLFLGEEHARVLVLLDGDLGEVQARSMAPVGSAAARSTFTIAGATLDPKLGVAYREVPGGVEIPVDNAGVQRLVLSQIGADVQVSVETRRARDASSSVLEGRGLLLDLRVPGAPEDDSLPEADALASWMKGVLSTSTGARSPRDRPRIVVDAGHGGHDPGAVGYSGTHESDIVMSLARKVGTGLERQLDAEVIYTRADDTFIPLRGRAALANAQDADLFLSIHANASTSSTVHGITTFYLDVASDAAAAAVAARENAALLREGGTTTHADATEAVMGELVISGNSALSRRLALEVHTSVIDRVTGVYGAERVRDLGVQTAMFYVLVSPRMPSILFEASFVTNPEDELRLRTPAFQNVLSAAIVDGVARYLAVAEDGP